MALPPGIVRAAEMLPAQLARQQARQRIRWAKRFILALVFLAAFDRQLRSNYGAKSAVQEGTPLPSFARWSALGHETFKSGCHCQVETRALEAEVERLRQLVEQRETELRSLREDDATAPARLTRLEQVR